MDNKNSVKNLFSVNALGLSLRVFNAGADPRLNAGKRSATDPSVMKGLHSHFTYEIFFVTQGTLQLVTAEKTVTFERRTVIIPPKISHYSYPSESGSYCLLFEFREADGKRETDELRKILDGGICELPISEDVAFYITKACEKLDLKTFNAEKEAELLISLLFCEVFGALLPDEHKCSVYTRETKHISAIEKHINSHIGERITLADAASSVYLSTRQVSRIVKREYGCTFSELVCEKKLATAEMLVKNSSLSMSEIARQIGLGTENYFYTLFKKRYGKTPLQYRRSFRKIS